MVIVLIFLIFCILNSKDDFNKNSDDNTIQGKDEVVQENDEIEFMENIKLLTDKYLWKMKVINEDGAILYKYPNSEILTKLSLGSEIYAIGDRYSYENGYYITVAYTIGTDNVTNYGYIKYTDLTLLDDVNYFSNNYETSSKYLVIDDEAYLYNGPGLLFEEKNNKINIPVGEILDVSYYNVLENTSNKWLYVTYNDYSGWILECVDATERNVYDENIEGNQGYKGCVRKVNETNGNLMIGTKIKNLYSDFAMKEKIDVIPENTNLKYYYTVNSGGGRELFNVDYNNKSGWIVGVYTDDCSDVDGDETFFTKDKSSNNYKFCQ